MFPCFGSKIFHGEGLRYYALQTITLGCNFAEKISHFGNLSDGVMFVFQYQGPWAAAILFQHWSGFSDQRLSRYQSAIQFMHNHFTCMLLAHTLLVQ